MNKFLSIKGKLTRYDILFLFGVVVSFLFILWKVPFGAGGWDEPFYLTIPHRLAMGDSLLSEEWNLSQLSGFLIYPLMKIYLFITHSTEGIMLRFRYFYAAFQLIIGIMIYLNLRKYKVGGIFAALLFMIFTPYNIMALSYNTMGLGLMVLTGVLMSNWSKLSNKRLVIGGFLFAGAVLCCPYLVFVYLLYLFFVIVYQLTKRINPISRLKEDSLLVRYCSIKVWLFFTLGIFFLSLLFVAFIFSRASLRQIMDNLPLMLKIPEHTYRSFWDSVLYYKDSLVFIYEDYIYLWGSIILLTILDRGRLKRRSFYITIIIVSAIVCNMNLLKDVNVNFNYIMLPIAVVGLIAYILCNNKDKNLFLWCWVSGLLYSFILSCSSNQGSDAIAMALSLSGIASVVFIIQMLAEMRQDNKKGFLYKFVFLVISGYLCTQIFAQVYVKINHTYWEESIKGLNTKIEEGPLKGVVTAEDKAGSYRLSLEDVREYSKVRDDNILFGTKHTWYYLYANMPYACPSAWIQKQDAEMFAKWLIYFELHPDKVPQYIYFPKGEGWDLTELFNLAPQYNYYPIETGRGYMLERIAE